MSHSLVCLFFLAWVVPSILATAIHHKPGPKCTLDMRQVSHKDPKKDYNYYYDLTPLKIVDGHFIEDSTVNSEGEVTESYYINICGAATSPARPKACIDPPTGPTAVCSEAYVDEKNGIKHYQGYSGGTLNSWNLSAYLWDDFDKDPALGVTATIKNGTNGRETVLMMECYASYTPILRFLKTDPGNPKRTLIKLAGI